MAGRRKLTPVLGLGLVLLVLAVWLSFDNPSVDGTSRGEDYGCLAPWDTVLNGADNFPGGEPPVDGDDIARRCRQAGRDRFTLAVAAGVLGLSLVAVGFGSGLRRGRLRPRS